MAGEGKKLVQSLSAVSAYGKEFDTLCETLNDLLTQEFAKASLPCQVAGAMGYSERQDEAGWIYTDVAHSLPLKGKMVRKGRSEMYLGYQISLTGNGMSFARNDEPLLHVCLWDDDLNFNINEESYMGYPLAQDPPFTLKDGRLIVWDGQGDGWKKKQWTFSIRLLSLDSSQALIERVIKPTIKLLNDEPATSALPDNLPGLIIYADESVLKPFPQENVEVK